MRGMLWLALAAGAAAMGAAPVAVAAATPKAKPAARTASGRPDFSGVWENEPGRWPTLPYTPEYKATWEQRRALEASGTAFATPASHCLPPGLPWIMTGGAYPMEIYQWDSQVTMVRENLGSTRRIQLKRPHDPDAGPTFNGDSVGHWEGDVLVVDTDQITPDAPILGLLPHSDTFHVVERIRAIDRDTLEDRITIDDAKALTAPVTINVTYTRADTELREYNCDVNRNAYDAQGKSIILPSGPK